MSTVTVTLNRFDGGMTNDPRDPRTNVCRVCQHFDAFTNPHKLTPYRSAESGDSSASTHGIANYEYVGGTLYGLGIKPSGTAAMPFTRTDFTGDTWTVDAGGYSLISARADIDLPAFRYYKTTGKLYGVRGGQYVWSVVPGTSANASEADLTSYSHVSNIIVHSADDCLYLGYDNKIARNNNGSWEVTALTLPTDYIVTSICEYGNYLAIGARPNSSTLKSRVWLWDRDSSLTTLSESIDWGEGNLMVLEELDGYLVGVSFTGDTGSYSLKSRVTFKYYANGIVTPFEQLVGFSQSPAVSSTNFKQKENGRILFSANIPVVSTSYCGVWAIRRSGGTQPFSVTLDRVYSSVTSTTAPYGFIKLGDYTFSSFTNSATFALDKTDDAANYTLTSLYESTVNPGMPITDREKSKQLSMVAIATEPLTSGQQIVLKYRVDGGAWTTIATLTTISATVTEYAFDTNGDPFASGREYEFHVESTGGAEITGIIYKYRTLATFL